MDSNVPKPPGENPSVLDHDQAELRLLSRLHYALAILTALASLLAIPFICAGRVALEELSSGALDHELVALVLLMGGISWAVLCVLHAGVLVYFGRLIRSCRRWWLVMIFSALHTINIPLGTALSIYTLMVLSRESVKRRFG
jgi:hypothetical protein